MALFCCLVAPPFAVYDSHNQDERQQVATFITNLAVFPTKNVCYARSAPKIAGEIHQVWFTVTVHHSRNYQNMNDDQLSSKPKDTSTSIVVDNFAMTRECVLSKCSTMSTQWTSSYSQSESPSVAEFTTAAPASRSDIYDTMWLIDDDDALTSLTASTVTGSGETSSPLAEAEVEGETDLFLKQLHTHYGACYLYLITW